MRRAGAGLKGPRLDAAAAAALEQHRDRHFRRTSSRRVTGERAALGFINQVGFCTAFTAGLGVPCLREAIAGEREPPLPEHLQHDYAIGMTWRIKDSLPARRLVYYGKVIAGRPGFVALDLLPAFMRLRVEPGGYLRTHRRGELSLCAKLVMDALSKRGPAETRALKLSSGFARPSRRAEFDRAMKELQGKFLALKVEERYEPFTYVWDTVEHRWAGVLKEARALSAREAALAIARRHFEVAGYAAETAAARLLGIDPAAMESAARTLEREGLILRGARLETMPGTFSVLAEYASAAR
jgi:hypothetical protein